MLVIVVEAKHFPHLKFGFFLLRKSYLTYFVGCTSLTKTVDKGLFDLFLFMVLDNAL